MPEENLDDEIIVCPKCKLDDPGDWSQCKGSCPMPESPHYKKPIFENFVDTWGTWNRFKVLETSKVFKDWLAEVSTIVMEGWTLKVYNVAKFIKLDMVKDGQRRVFAFVKKSTGDIHCPATSSQAFDHFVGNICDPETRLSVLGPLGVTSHWSWLPTHPDYNPSKELDLSDISDYNNSDSDDNEDEDDAGE